jgi:leucyl aminopeptidase
MPQSPEQPLLHVVPARALLDDIARASSDALVVVAPAPIVERAAALGARVAAAAEAAARADASLAAGKARPPVVLPAPGLHGERLVLAPMPPLTEDTDDVRLVAEATAAAVARAVEAGARRPLLVVETSADPRFARAREVAALAALGTRWAPLEAREADKAPPRAAAIGVVGLDPEAVPRLCALDVGRSLCRDITGTEPERMAPLRVAEICEQAFAGTGVGVHVEHDLSSYPLLEAVARASRQVARHRPAVVTLDYRPPGPVRRMVVLAGKGVTYDTGGADLKTDGHMAGASRDKGGAGAIAGLLRAVAGLAIDGVRVVGLLGMVRNSVGEDAYVSDEIIRSRAGVRVRIGNTDAEGRLVLADLLARAKEIAKDQPDPLVFSLATLTGHVYRTHGPYTGVLGNGIARERGVVDALDRLGELWGEPFERSRPRREDCAMVAPRTSAEDVVSSNRLASVNTPRGHQFPFAFLDIAAGLRGERLPFSHIDIAGTAMEGADWQFGRPTGVPIATLAAYLKEL